MSPPCRSGSALPLKASGASLIAALAFGSYSPPRVPRAVPEGEPFINVHFATLTCTLSKRTTGLSCVPESGMATSRGAEQAGVPRFGLVSGPVRFDAATGIATVDLRLANLSSAPIGTEDGRHVTASKVFVASRPVVYWGRTGRTTLTRIVGADGVGNFTSAAQLFFVYGERLGPHAKSRARRWGIVIPAHADSVRFSVGLHTPTPSVPWIPESAPMDVADTTWAALTNAANILDNPPSITGRVVRNVLYVKFKPGATALSREKAILAVSGIVVGGNPVLDGVPDGYYLIKLPLASGSDSSSGPLLRAEATLNALPSVELTDFLFMDELTSYRRAYRRGARSAISQFTRAQGDSVR